VRRAVLPVLGEPRRVMLRFFLGEAEVVVGMVVGVVVVGLSMKRGRRKEGRKESWETLKGECFFLNGNDSG